MRRGGGGRGRAACGLYVYKILQGRNVKLLFLSLEREKRHLGVRRSTSSRLTLHPVYALLRYATHSKSPSFSLASASRTRAMPYPTASTRLQSTRGRRNSPCG